jgi:hypothetical protein
MIRRRPDVGVLRRPGRKETPVTRKILVLVAAGIMFLTACDDDDGDAVDTVDETTADTSTDTTEDSDGSIGTVQQQAAELAIAAAGVQGLELDEDCVNEIAAELSDEDAQLIVDAGPDGDPALSAEGEALTTQLLTCVDEDALIDLFVAGLEESGEDFDEDCVRESLEDVDLGAALGEDEAPPELIQAVTDCVETGG